MKIFRILESEMLRFDELLEVSSDSSSEVSSLNSYVEGSSTSLTSDVSPEEFDELLKKTRASSGENLEELSAVVEPPPADPPEKSWAEPKAAPAAVVHFCENFIFPPESNRITPLHKSKKSSLTKFMGPRGKRGKISSKVQSSATKQGKLMVLVTTKDYSPVRLPAAGLMVKEVVEDYLRAEGIAENTDGWEVRLMDGKEPDFDLPPLEADQKIEDFRANKVYLLRKPSTEARGGGSWSEDYDGFEVGSKFKEQNVVPKVKKRFVGMPSKQTDVPPPVVEDFHSQDIIGRDFFVIDIGTAQKLRKDTKDVPTSKYKAEIIRRIPQVAVRITVPFNFRLFQLLGVLSSRKVEFLVTNRLCSTVFELFFSRDRLEIGSSVVRIPNSEPILVINQKFRRRNIREYNFPAEPEKAEPPEIVTVDAETVYHQQRRNAELLVHPNSPRRTFALPMEKSIGEILSITFNEFRRKCFTVIYSHSDITPELTCVYEAPDSQMSAELVAKLRILVKAVQKNRKLKIRRNSISWGSRDDISRPSHGRAMSDLEVDGK
eukprot:GHVP01051338.1.p1 GENE.GHVP01051338.1~~GHVP01051338.1.p1  ORF type:complete len:546 (+),score=102.47 GHVP01051338.1:457-2094(+)